MEYTKIVKNRKKSPNINSSPKESVEILENKSVAITNQDGSVAGYYSTDVPKLKIEGTSSVQELQITLSASESDDDLILHELLLSVRRNNKDFI